MAEILHTLSVSPEKRRAFREYLTLDKEMEEDRYASALTFSEDAAIWESLAAAGAVGTTAATTAGRSVGIWFGRAAALLAVGVIGYILGSSSTSTTITTTGSGNRAVTMVSRPAPSITRPQTVPAPVAPHSIPAQQSVKQVTLAASGARSGSTGNNGPGRPAGPHGTMASADAGNLEGARQMFDLLGGLPASASNELPFTSSLPVVDSTPAHGAPLQEQPATQPQIPSSIDTAMHPKTEAALRQIPNPIPIEGEESSPVSSLFHNGFETAFSERLGLLTPAPQGVSNPDREFSYRALDLSYRMNGGQLGFGLRLGYGTFSRVSLDSVPVTRANDNGISDATVKYTSTLTASTRVSAEIFVNYRHPLSERIALALEASFGGSSSHQQSGVDLTMIGFITDRIGLQIGGGAGTYWYNLTAERNQVLAQHPNAAIDNDSKQAYRGIMLLGRYGLFYRF